MTVSDLWSIAPGAWFAVGYALALLTAAYGIDAMARRAATKVEQQRHGGFVYHPDHDAWLCPEDQWLWPQSFDPENRVMRYRGSPTVCNACPVRDACTSSDGGREVQRQVDPWPASESARFHRGIACTVTVLAVLWPLTAALTGMGAAESWLLVVVATIVMVASLPLWSHLRHSPADPTGVLVRGPDDNVAEREQTARRHRDRRTSYWSDRRDEAEELRRGER